MSRSKKIVDLKYNEIIHETDAATLFLFGEEQEVWLPKSWTEIDERDHIVSLPEFRAVEKEIEEYAQ